MKTVLLGERYRTGGHRKQNLYYSFSSELGKQFGEFAAGHFGWYLDGALEGKRAGIEALIHTHDGHAGLALSVHYGAFYGSGPAVLGQERGVHVVGVVFGGVQGFGAQYLAVGSDDEGVVL